MGWFWPAPLWLFKSGFISTHVYRNTFIVVVVVVVASTRAPWLSIPALSFCCLSGFFHPLLTQEHVCETFALAQPARHLLNSFKMRLDMFMRLCVGYCVRVLQAFLAWGISLKGETCSSIFISCVKLDKRSVFFTSVRTERDGCCSTLWVRDGSEMPYNHRSQQQRFLVFVLFLQTAGLLCLLHILHQQLLAFSLFT